MKRLLSLLPIFLLSAAIATAQTASKCARTVTAGGVALCMPKMEGFQECYEHEQVKPAIDASDGAGNLILGVYLPDSLHAQADLLPNIALDKYYKIYMTQSSLKVNVKPDDLEAVEKQFTAYLHKEKWEEIKKKAEAANESKGLELGKPTLLETYYTGITAVSYQILIPVQQGENSMTVITNVSQVILRNRLVWIAYYSRYTDEGSLIMSKVRGQEMLRKLQFSNL